MSFIPEVARGSEICSQIHAAGCQELYVGKVRQSYDVLGYPKLMLVVATDRISIFDHVLPALIPNKGAVLTALTIHWFTTVFKDIKSHLVAYGAGIDEYLPEELRGNIELQSRAIVVLRVIMLPIEFIIRGCLTGSGWKSYKEDGTVCGMKLRDGYVDGSQLDDSLFTPSTKADEGHDVNITFEQMVEILTPFFATPKEAKAKALELEAWTLNLFKSGVQAARKKGIELLDTKFEIGLDPQGNFVLADEVLTPDSSRFSSRSSLAETVTKGKPPESMDKEVARTWGKEVGVNKFKHDDPDYEVRLSALKVPENIIRTITRLYRFICWKLTGVKLEKFQQEIMGMDVKNRPIRVEVVLGSMTDISQVRAGLELAGEWGEDVVVVNGNVISAHRNPLELQCYAQAMARTNPDIIIACAGKAAALPGNLKAHLCAAKMSYIPVIGVGLNGSSEEANQAARLAIKELPGSPVELQADGEPYMGQAGFAMAMRDILAIEFMVRGMEYRKAHIGVDLLELQEELVKS